MKCIRSKDYSINGRSITLEKYEGKRRVPHSRKWAPCTFTKTIIRGINNNNLDFFLTNDFGDLYASFSLEFLSKDDRKAIANGNEDLLAQNLDDADLIHKSGLHDDVAKAYSDWYGANVR